jgi:hypothetical protein
MRHHARPPRIPDHALRVIAVGRDGPRVSGGSDGRDRRTTAGGWRGFRDGGLAKSVSTYALATHAPFAHGRRRCLLAACLCSTPPPSGSAFAAPA